jgi:hypothetical protein
MPLIHSKSNRALQKNIKTEMDENPGPSHRAQNLAIAYAIKRKAKKFAHGGFVQDEEESGYEDLPDDHDAVHEDDIVERAMKKRMYSKGGMVANGGEDDLDNLADGKPNEFDDLAMRDDLEFSYDGKNSGDERGHPLEEDDDIVSRIMKKRAQHNPRPA